MHGPIPYAPPLKCCVHVLSLQLMNCGQVAKVLVGFTKLRHYDAELCLRLADAAERNMANASGVHLAQIIWSLSHQRYEQPGVFEAAALQVSRCWACTC